MKQYYSSLPSISTSPNYETRNWLDLPRDITATILLKVGPIDVLNNAQRVCTQWRSITKDPDLWRVIDMTKSMEVDFDIISRHVIDRSHGSLVAISLSHFVSDNLLHYIADSASHLQRLRLLRCCDISNTGLSEAMKKLPFLEELELNFGKVSKISLEAIGRCCPLLKSLKLNMQIHFSNVESDDEKAFAIAENMPNLCHLQLLINRLTDEGLLAILDGCLRLESLDLRLCFNVKLKGSLGRRCDEQIKYFLKPCPPCDEYPFKYSGVY